MTHLRSELPRTPTAAWLFGGARVTDTPAGDLIADMRREMRRGVEFPPVFPNMVAMRSYFLSKGACPEALAVVPGVWRRYRS